MSYSLSSFQIQEIQQNLPPELAALMDIYPVAVANAAGYYRHPPFPEGFEPEVTEIYLDEYTDGPAIIANKQVGIVCDPDFWVKNPRVFLMDWNHQSAYIRVGNVILLNRLPKSYKLPDLSNIEVTLSE